MKFDNMSLYRAKEMIPLPKEDINHISKGGLIIGFALNQFVENGNELDETKFEMVC